MLALTGWSNCFRMILFTVRVAVVLVYTMARLEGGRGRQVSGWPRYRSSFSPLLLEELVVYGQQRKKEAETLLHTLFCPVYCYVCRWCVCVCDRSMYFTAPLTSLQLQSRITTAHELVDQLASSKCTVQLMMKWLNYVPQ